MKFFFLVLLYASLCRAETAVPLPRSIEVPQNRMASVYISQDFLNEQISKHIKTNLVKDFKIVLDPDGEKILFHGIAQVPTEELKAINLDPSLGKFSFQISAKLSTTPKGYLIIELPLNETYFYPYNSQNRLEDRVIVPVQLLSIGLASIRGYLAALSGDFGGFDRRTEKLKSLMKALDREIEKEKNPDAKDAMNDQRESLRLQIEAIPIERKQLKTLSKEFSAFFNFTGEKELSLNDDLAAHKNALVIKIAPAQLTPYLQGVTLGGIRVRHDKKDGGGQNYFVVDLNSDDDKFKVPPLQKVISERPAMKVAPSLIVRLNQTLFESEAVLNAEKKQMGEKLKDFNISLQDDGLHVSGSWKGLFFVKIPFETIVDLTSSGLDQFEARVREIKVAGLNFDFLRGFILDSLKRRLDVSMKGICNFDYVGNDKDNSRILRVTVKPDKLVPAFPDLHLVNVDVRSREFLMKIGR